MVTGILLGIILIMLLCNVFVKKLKSTNKKTFRGIHKGLGIVFIGIALLHLCLTLPLFRQRPLLMYVFGAIMLICGVGEALTYVMRKRLKNKWMMVHRTLAVLLFLCIIVHMISGFASLKDYKDAVAAVKVENVDLSNVKDGEYIGEYDAGYIFAKVSVKVEAGKLTSVELLEHRNEHGKKAEVITDSMLNEQKIAVDAVSGATNSSKVIEQAVYNALTKQR